MSEAVKITAGSMLKQAREQAGLEIQAVADRLHLRPRQVTALETDQYQLLGTDIFCRGYIKSYCKFLSIENAPVLDRYIEQLPDAVVQETTASKRPRPIQLPGKGYTIQYWFAAVTLMVAVGLWFAHDQLSPKASSAPVMVSGLSVEQQPTKSAVQQVFELAAINAETTPEQAPQAETAQPELVAEVIDPEYQEPTEQTLLTENIVAAVVERASDWLNFQFSDDCWVEVKDKDNAVIYADLKRADDTLQVSGKPPFKVLLGYAPGVSLDYNGEPVDIEVNRKNNSARLTVGDL